MNGSGTWITGMLRTVVGLIFLLAGALKIQALGQAELNATVVGQFFAESPEWIMAISMLEIGVGAFLLFGVLPAPAIASTAAIVAGVSIWLIVDERFADTPCGCFGDTMSIFETGTGSFALRNAILCCSLLWLLFARRSRQRTEYAET